MRLQATEYVKDASYCPDGVRVASREKSAVLRQQATVSGGTRPPRATESAAVPLVDDPALAAVVADWPDLPDTIRAGILAMVTDCEVLKNSI
jgi:hypothetical protein